MELRHALLVYICCLCVCVPFTWSVYIKATEDYGESEGLSCDFTVEEISDTSCDTSLRQVFRILLVNEIDDKVLLGSTECLYLLNQNLTLDKSTNISLSTYGRGVCEFAITPENRPLRCENYVSYGYEQAADEYRVCGTFSSQQPVCWTCTDNNTDLICDSKSDTQHMPRTPSQNFTIARASEDGNPYYFLGAIESHTSSKPLFARIPDRTSAVPSDDPDIITSSISTKWMYDPQDFVGEPIEYNGFIYFFFRERALEYDNIGQIIYSRVARICKNDSGGTTSPLKDKFTTYLKARLVCSVGTDFPSYFNEIQDVKRGKDDNTMVYGLFNTPNAGRVSSAICRYDLDELEELFNNDFRRGPPKTTELWQRIDKHSNDDLPQRTCQVAYDYNEDDIYDHLDAYPLLNTFARNCRLGLTCDNYARTSDDADALAVFPGIQGQKLAVLSDSSDLEVLIGTNDKTIYRAIITEETASTTHKYVINDDTTISDSQRDAKWPYGVSYLELHGDQVYGTLDQCAFMFSPPSETIIPPSYTIRHRSDIIPYNHTVRITDAVTNVFQLFDAPIGTGLSATWSPEEENCNQHRFTTDVDSKCKEFLHVHCQITGEEVQTHEINITVTSLENRADPLTVVIPVNRDDSERAMVSEVEMSRYDKEIAEYLYKYNEWLENSVTCENGVKDTCPSPDQCCEGC